MSQSCKKAKRKTTIPSSVVTGGETNAEEETGPCEMMDEKEDSMRRIHTEAD